MSKDHRARRNRLITLLRVVVPLTIIGFILTQIEFSELWVHLRSMEPAYYLLGVAISPLAVMVGSLRWKYMMKAGVRRGISYWFLLKHYMIGMSIGMFMPGSIGADVYKVVVAGNRYPDYPLQIIVIISEKMAALATAILAVVILHPFVDKYIVVERIFVEYLHFYSVVGLAASGIILLLALVSRLRRIVGLIIRKGVASYNRLAAGITERIKSVSDITVDEAHFLSIFRRTLHAKSLLIIVVLSLIIIAVAALRMQIFLQGMDYEFPILANLYIVPIMTFLFMLPISFGGVGIREAAFILMYGMFGIPVEAALALSLFSLSTVLINNGIGGIVLALSKGDDLLPIDSPSAQDDPAGVKRRKGAGIQP